MSNVIHFR